MKNNANCFVLKNINLIAIVVLILASLFVYFLIGSDEGLGLLVGSAAFFLAFFSIEKILLRVWGVENIKNGVFSSGKWVFLKFFGPICLIWLGARGGLDPLWIFAGLSWSLVVVATSLYVRDKFSAKPVE
jgi:hypothetical protein